MTTVLSVDQKLSLGFKARRLRLSQLLTTQELASMAGVSQEDVNLLENNLPLQLDSKRKLFRALRARKASSKEHSAKL